MATFIVGFDGKWQEKFDDEDEAIAWAREVAETGRTVEVVRRRFGFCKFLTGFTESEREALEARWRRLPLALFGDNGTYGSAGHHYGHAHGGHGGGHGGHGGGH
ncbi:MAG TPA: hypothetical protein VG816_08505 [Solirubrobacterales bacterium]|nr:hypothetical protein [Solirubrobacterales bacterium]